MKKANSAGCYNLKVLLPSFLPQRKEGGDFYQHKFDN